MEKIEWAKLKTITGLALPDAATDRQELELNNELDKFIENLPSKTYELIKLLIVRDYAFLQTKLGEMAAALNKIHAVETAKKCHKLADFVKGDVAKSEADIVLEKLVSELNTLSIDIQTVEYKSREADRPVEHIKHDAHSRSNILAVDDDPVILNVLKQVIDGEKYKFSGAVSGKTALKYLETHELPDLIILDIEMPEMNGYEFAESIAATQYGIPVIFLTSNATREHIMKAMQTGAVDFLVKPVNEELILSKLEKYVE